MKAFPFFCNRQLSKKKKKDFQAQGLIFIPAYQRNLENRSNSEIPLDKGNPHVIELCSGNVDCEEEGLCNRTGVPSREASTSHNNYSCLWLLGSFKRQGIKVAPT